MRQQRLTFSGIPAVLYGEESENVYLFLHGQSGNKEEAGAFAAVAAEKGYQVLGLDLPGHGERKSQAADFVPWVVVPQLQRAGADMAARWKRLALRANSIGAWFSLLAFADLPLEKCLLVSPILSMETLIKNMMGWAGVTEERLAREKTIPTDFGQTLSWEYLCYVREHPIENWHWDTRILYADGDTMTDGDTVSAFARRFHCGLCVMEGGEHWFHTEEQLAFLRQWESKEV